MRKIVIIALMLGVLSCEDRSTKSFIESLNDPPKINFANGVEVPILSDSLKVGIGGGRPFYRINLQVTDGNSNLNRVEYSQLAGLGTLFQDRDTIFDSNIDINADILEFDYYPRTLGLHEFVIEAIDNFEESNSVRVQITAFDNLPPVAKFNVQRIGQLSRYQYRIDATESFDRDSRFGGRVSEYEYSVVGKIFKVFDSRLEFIFPDAGVYIVSVRVMDNDRTFSAPVELTIEVD